MTEEELIKKVDAKSLIVRPLTDWRPILAEECGVYACEDSYLAKRFDRINYKFCGKDEAKEILVDNLYALLRYKYFTSSSEEIDDRISKIVSSFTTNLKSTLKRVSFAENADCTIVKYLPDYCVAFRNGVYDFKNNDWFFKYSVYELSSLNNKIYVYDSQYVINWYFDYDFEPLPVKISDVSLKEMIELMREITKTNKNYCFELMYNISHDRSDQFSYNKFRHLCEILGYTLLQSFSQNFVMLIGSGQNGKNSLFDGCFTNRLFPRPSAIDLETIEKDDFITGALQNKSHNIFLETDADVMTRSKIIKSLTGSMYQTIHEKGIGKYSGIINCKYIFAGNDKDKIKFSDNTIGFRRRINLLEIFYHWDSQKRFLKRGDYYDTTFSDSLKELTHDASNTTCYVYFGMYGILSATENFTKNFKFTFNEWTDFYTDLDEPLKEAIDRITPQRIALFLSSKNAPEYKSALFDENKKQLKDSHTIKELGYEDFTGLIQMLENEEAANNYFSNHDFYISLRILQEITKNISAATVFTQNVKKIFKINNMEYLYANKPFAKARFINNKLILID